MRFLLLTAALAAFWMPASAAGLVPDRVAKALSERVAAGQYPVVVVGIVDGDRSEVQAFGTLPDGKPANGDTVFEIGSVTKTFTATLLADAVLKDGVRLDQPVADLLPGWSIPEHGGKKITLADLATQRSGLPRMPGNFVPANPQNPYPDYDSKKLEAFLRGYSLPRDPGAQYEYSNLGFAVLGTALARHAHTSYGELLRQKILKPLGMKDTDVVTTDAMRPRLAPGRNEEGKPAQNWDFDVFAPAGAIRSTANDMMRYLQANMAAAPSTPMAMAQQPLGPLDKGSKLGLAWMVTDKLGIVWHNGMTGGYAAFIGFSGDRKHGVVMLTNAAVSLEDVAFATLVPDAPIEPARASVTLSNAALDEVCGSFKLPEGLVIHIFREGDQLFLRAEGQEPLAVYPSGSSDFFARIVPISVSFTRDGAGKVTGMVLHQNGDHAATKIVEAEATLDEKTLGEYAGTYSLGSYGDFVFRLKDGRLYAQLATQPEFAIYASAKDKFYYKVVEAQLDFERDGSGKVTAVVLHQNGHDTRAPRKP